MAIVVSRKDARYETLNRGHNVRWPAAESDAAGSIVLCESANDVAEALQRTVDAGQRPTIRSGAHCYEDFVANNPGGTILDLSLLSEVSRAPSGSAYRIQPGTLLWTVYQQLYKRYGLTLPAGTCGTVGAGGHIGGGGYGLLSRLHGLTCDWLTAVDILTVDAKGKVIARTVDADHDADLFRACRGAAGGNFGIVTSYNFDKLPPAPTEVALSYMNFPWAETSEDRFVEILRTFGEYWETRGQDADTWGLFSVMTVGHASKDGKGNGCGISVQFCNPDGSCKDLTVVEEYLNRFEHCGGVAMQGGPVKTAGKVTTPAANSAGANDPAQAVCVGRHMLRQKSWLEATGDEAGGPGNSRGKYKSAYMKRGFNEAEARCMYKHMFRTMPGVEYQDAVVEIDSYGGAINRKGLAETTAVAQRSSVIKMQPMTFWDKPEEEVAHCQWMHDFYTDLFSSPDSDPKHAGTPYPGERYEGCYINYPDKDMLAYSHWPQLYYGNGDLYPFLQGVKRKYDPNNIFHHALSVRT